MALGGSSRKWFVSLLMFSMDTLSICSGKRWQNLMALGLFVWERWGLNYLSVSQFQYIPIHKAGFVSWAIDFLALSRRDDWISQHQFYIKHIGHTLEHIQPNIIKFILIFEEIGDNNHIIGKSTKSRVFQCNQKEGPRMALGKIVVFLKNEWPPSLKNEWSP